MATVRLPGGPTLSYREWGRPDGAVVLMLHGLGSTSHTWRHVAPVLGERFRVIALDARGHGDSEWTKDYPIDAFRSDVVRFMDELGILAAIVVGHSMGAVTAYSLAAQNPERVRLLVLEEMPPPDPAKPPRPLPKQSHPADDTDWRAVIALRRWRNEGDKSMWALANRVSARTLILSGARSYLSSSRTRTLADAMPHARITTLDLGHDLHTERPSAFLREVEAFVADFAK